MLLETQLHSYHEQHSEMTEFAGYEMPLWYTTTSEEHMAVRTGSGIFDVSHMGRILVEGSGATDFVESLVPTNVRPQAVWKAFYTLLLNERAGIIDDLIVMRLAEERYMLVVNAANASTDLDHIEESARAPSVRIETLTQSSAMIAVQGPRAAESLQPLTDVNLQELKRFRCNEGKVAGEPSLVSRTGYTGEDGFEVVVRGPTAERPEGALRVWDALSKTSTPCGLGARDSLRLEAGFPLHGTDIDDGTDPYQADLSWVLSAGKSGFVGSKAVSELSSHPPSSIRRGLVLGQGIPRHGFEVVADSQKVGTVTSGTFSPILRKGIAQAMVGTQESAFGTRLDVMVRGSRSVGTVTKTPFYDEQAYGWKRAQQR